jgi:Putative Flp pilus-assembly TadE/G-like
MKKLIPSTQSGQALVMIALAAIGLFAFAALAIDGSAIFSDRRHAQNAADTGALAAALTKVRGGDWEHEGLARAESNGYDDNGITNDVLFFNPPNSGPYQGNDEYIQVKIRSDVKLFFARIIGRQTATNYVEAVARASIPKVTTWFDGQALVSTMPGCKGDVGWNHDPFVVNGNSGTTVVNSGIFVNALCDGAYDQGGSSRVETDTGVCVVDGATADSTNTIPPPNDNCAQKDTSMYTLPSASCGTQVGMIDKISTGNYEASPGTYSGSFPSDALPNGSPAGILKLKKGIYCFDDGIDFQSTWTVTTNLNGNVDASGKDIHDSDSEGVFLFVRSGDVTFNGTSDIYLHAINSLDFPEKLRNYLMYLPPTNEGTIKITGDDGSSFIGTILAPHAHVVLNGGSGTVGLDTQIIGYSVAIEGNGTLDINFNQANNGMTLYQPATSLAQ